MVVQIFDPDDPVVGQKALDAAAERIAGQDAGLEIERVAGRDEVLGFRSGKRRAAGEENQKLIVQIADASARMPGPEQRDVVIAPEPAGSKPRSLALNTQLQSPSSPNTQAPYWKL